MTLFESTGDDENPKGQSLLNLPNGCIYLSHYLDPSVASGLLHWLDGLASSEWREDLSRRVIHYGWRYDYRFKAITPDMEIGPLPAETNDLAVALFDDGHFDRVPDQVIVNEYLPGQGIAMHTDHPDFGPTVATMSLGDAWTMEFRDPKSNEQYSHLLVVMPMDVVDGLGGGMS